MPICYMSWQGWPDIKNPFEKSACQRQFSKWTLHTGFKMLDKAERT